MYTTYLIPAFPSSILNSSDQSGWILSIIWTLSVVFMVQVRNYEIKPKTNSWIYPEDYVSSPWLPFLGLFCFSDDLFWFVFSNLRCHETQDRGSLKSRNLYRRKLSPALRSAQVVLPCYLQRLDFKTNLNPLKQWSALCWTISFSIRNFHSFKDNEAIDTSFYSTLVFAFRMEG